jgi:hypothetical protein
LIFLTLLLGLSIEAIELKINVGNSATANASALEEESLLEFLFHRIQRFGYGLPR